MQNGQGTLDAAQFIIGVLLIFGIAWGIWCFLEFICKLILM